MTYTLTLNPALDCFLRPESFAPGEICRYDRMEFVPGGKGINVSLLLNSLGADTIAAGITAGFTGRELARLLELEGCRTDFTQLPSGLTRVNVKILGEPETALNGAGPEITLRDLEPLMEKLHTLHEGDFLVLAGSVPPSLPEDVYARFMDAVPEGVRTIVDASGPALTEAVGRGPFLIKPNLDELGAAFGVKLREEEAPEYGERLRGMGARNVAVTLGGGGALLLTGDGRVLRRGAIPGREVSSVGAGDSFVAGFIYGCTLRGDMEEALGWAMAAGAATAFTQGIAEGADVRRLYEKHYAPIS